MHQMKINALCITFYFNNVKTISNNNGAFRVKTEIMEHS